MKTIVLLRHRDINNSINKQTNLLKEKKEEIDKRTPNRTLTENTKITKTIIKQE